MSEETVVPAVAPNRLWCRENVDGTVALDYGDETYRVTIERVSQDNHE